MVIDIFEGDKKYEVIYADPPWSYKNKSPTSAKRPSLYRSGQSHVAASYHYSDLSLKEICDLPVLNICAKNAVLFIWVTTPILPDVFDVLKAWGFKYKTTITWGKIRSPAPGYWFRGVTEHLILAVRGRVKAFRSMQKNLVQLKAGAHSAKPDEFRYIIEEAASGMSPRLELFARKTFAGWDSWGNEIA